MPVAESLLRCFESLQLLHNPDYLTYLFGDDRQARKSVAGSARSGPGQEKLASYLSRRPVTMMPSHVSFEVAVLALADPDNVRVSVQLSEALIVGQSNPSVRRPSVQGTVDDEHMPEALCNADGEVDFGDDDVAHDTVTRLSPEAVAEYALRDPYGSLTQPFRPKVPAVVHEGHGDVVQGVLNVDALQVTMPLSDEYVAGSVPPALAHARVFRGQGPDGGPPFAAIPVVEGVDPMMEEYFNCFWQSARMEVAHVMEGNPDYVPVLFPDSRYGHANPQRDWCDCVGWVPGVPRMCWCVTLCVCVCVCVCVCECV
jgi:hypothetical protein